MMIVSKRNPVVVMLLTCCAGMFVGARAEGLKDAAAVEAAYQQVRQTVDRTDDVAMARRMLSTAQNLPAADPLLEPLCDRAYQLTERDPEHFEIGVRAMQWLAINRADRAVAAMERAVEAAEYHYKRGLSQRKAEAGRFMIDAMTGLADQYAAEDQWQIAQTYYEAAASFAGDMDADNRRAIERRLARIEQHRKIAELERRFAERPGPALAAQLMRLQLVEMNDPHAAWEYWTRVQDADLKRHVELARRDPSALSPRESMDMGRWYEQQIENASLAMKPAMVRRAVAYYQRVTQVRYDAADVRTADAEQALARLGTFDPAAFAVAESDDPAADNDNRPAVADAATPTPEQWSNTLQRFNIDQLNVRNWKYDDGTLTIDARSPHRVAGIAAPLQITLWPRTMLNYECVMQLAYDENAESIGLIIPVRDRGMRLTLVGDRDDGAVAYLARQLQLKPNQRYTVRLNVVTIGDQVDVRLAVDGAQPLALSAGDKLVSSLTDAPSLGIYASDAVVHCYRADVKLLSPAQAAAEHQRHVDQARDGDGVIDFFGISGPLIR